MIRPLRVRAGGRPADRRVARILALAGATADPAPAPGPRSGSAPGPGRHVTDAFLRSVLPAAAGEPAFGLLLDRTGLHYDPDRPCDLEDRLATDPLDDPALMARSRAAMDWLARADLSFCNSHDPALSLPPTGHVLLIDEAPGNPALRASRADRGTFLALLARARTDHPGRRVLVLPDPAGITGHHRAGHLTARDLAPGEVLLSAPLSPRRLFAGAQAVYAVTSLLGFEAILAGHRPVLAGRPFYAGWGLTEDPAPLPRRGRSLRPEQIFAAAMILSPVWYDPTADRLCPLETAIAHLEAEVRAFREDRTGWVATGMHRWKRRHLRAFFGSRRPVRFADPPQRAAALARATGRPLMAWAGAVPPDLPATRIEDGFLRSRGLGADLVPPLSLCLDDLGIAYDPCRESRLERLIAEAAALPPAALARAAALAESLAAAGLTKYNLPGRPLPPDLPPGHLVLVPGQVEDDASIRLGAPGIRTNAGLLAAARAARPGAVLLYKPHPDVEAGLRPGALAEADRLADVILGATDAATAIGAADEVWTITSTLGFEALLRGKPVTCAGLPFYAGWGLTTDLVPAPARRSARPSLAALAHAALIAYPRYFDPVTGRPCPPEAAVHRLATADLPHPGVLNRALATLQARLAPHARLWRG